MGGVSRGVRRWLSGERAEAESQRPEQRSAQRKTNLARRRQRIRSMPERVKPAELAQAAATAPADSSPALHCEWRNT